MGIFGGEKYSKVEYQQAEGRVDAEEHALKSYTDSGGKIPGILNNFEMAAAEAKQKIEKLYGKGQAEANKLNEEYDLLMAKTLEAVKTLQEFEKNKLGMSDDETKH